MAYLIARALVALAYRISRKGVLRWFNAWRKAALEKAYLPGRLVSGSPEEAAALALMDDSHTGLAA
jgi:hypothetical protein